MFRVTSYYYVDVPLVLNVRINTTQDGDEEINTTSIYGLIRLTKKDGEWYIWDVSSALMLNDE